MLLRLLRTYLRPYRTWLTIIVILQAAGTIGTLYLPTLNADILDNGVLHVGANGQPAPDTHYILRTGAFMLLICVGQILCSIVAAYFTARTAMAFGRDVRRGIFTRVTSFSAREIGQFGGPSLITRNTNDVQQVQMLVQMGCTIVVMVPIMMVGSVILSMRQDLAMSWLLAVVIPVLILAVTLVVTRMVPSFRLVQARIDVVNRVLREQITGIRVVRAFVREPLEEQRFRDANDALTAVSLRAGRWLSTLFPLVMLIVYVASVAVLWVGGHRVEHGMQIGPMTAFLSYLMQTLMSVMMGTFMLMQLPRSSVCADRIGEVLDTETSVVPPARPVAAIAGRGELRFDGVGFTYPLAESPVLSGVSFEAHPGQTVAVIGSTGAGKSTLVNLIARLFDATAGRVEIDGVDVRELDPDELHRRIGLVPQKAYLFSGTIRSNLAYGKDDATDEEMWHALEVAQAKDFVSALEEGLDAPVAQGGTNFSGGQCQRLAIARALVRRPEIYLFDDSFSALDLTTDARLRAALAPETRTATVLIVAQRVSTIRDADLILVLEDGEVVGRGTHEQLVADNPTYQEIVASQLSAEEAA